MGFVPIIGAVAGAVGTVAQIGQQRGAARNQRVALDEQRRQMALQFITLQEQRVFQKDIANAEMGRMAQQAAAAESIDLFNNSLEQRSLMQGALLNEVQGMAELFQIQQQRLGELSEASVTRGQESDDLKAQSAQLEQNLQTEMEEDTTLSGQAARGQLDSLSSQAQGQARVQTLDDAFANFQQLFEMNMSVADQNKGISDRLAELQASLGTNEATTRKMLFDQDLAVANVQNRFNEQFIGIESQMNRAALDAELAGRLFNIEAAQTTDTMAYQGGVAQTKIQRDSVQGPSWFSALPALAQGAAGVYNAVTPLRQPTAQSLNPLANQQSVPNRPLNYSTGVMTDRTNSLFNIG